jgi:hypothetical protein
MSEDKIFRILKRPSKEKMWDLYGEFCAETALLERDKFEVAREKFFKKHYWTSKEFSDARYFN